MSLEKNYNTFVEEKEPIFKNCKRVINNKFCDNIILDLKSIRCINCFGLCTFKKHSGSSCKSQTFGYDIYCPAHYTLHRAIKDKQKEIEKYKLFLRAKEFHNIYIYCGYIDCGSVDNKPLYSYKYIEREALGNRKIEELQEYEYDIEINFTHKFYEYCGPNGIEKISSKNYPFNNMYRLLEELDELKQMD